MTTWTQEQSINFECAREAINHVIAIYSAEIYNEEKKSSPDVQRLEMMNDRCLQLTRERSAMHVNDDAMVAEVRAKYSAILRAHAKHQGSITDHDQRHQVS